MPFKIDITLLSQLLDFFIQLFKRKVSIEFTLAPVMVCMSKFGIKAFAHFPYVIKTMSEFIKKGILKFRLNECLVGC